MIYFDSDVLVHYFVGYAPAQYAQAKKHVEEALTNEIFYVSQLSMQELAYSMGKFEKPVPLIEEAMNVLRSVSPINYDLSHFDRAMQLAAFTGFSSINDSQIQV